MAGSGLRRVHDTVIVAGRVFASALRQGVLDRRDGVAVTLASIRTVLASPRILRNGKRSLYGKADNWPTVCSFLLALDGRTRLAR